MPPLTAPSRILACCRASLREADILPFWLAYYRPHVDTLLVAALLEPGDDLALLERQCAEVGAMLVPSRSARFHCPQSMSALQAAVQQYPAEWVLHADSDELLYEVADLRGIVAAMEQEGSDYARAWMTDRLAPGGRLAGMEGLHTVADLEAAFPVRAALTEKLAKADSYKVCLSRWPYTGSIHHPQAGQTKKATRRLTLEHFKWRAGMEERLRKRVRDHKAARLAWGCESERLLAELETHGRLRAELWLTPRSRRIHGWMDYEDIYRDAVRAAPDGAHFVEVGVWQGRSLCYLAEVMLACGKRLRLDGVDLFRDFTGHVSEYPEALRSVVQGRSWLDVVSANLRRQGMLDYVNLIQAASPAAAGLYEDGSLDFVWVDGCHTSSAVEADCRAWWPKIRPGVAHEQWSEWLPQPRAGEPPWPESKAAYRFRVQRILPPPPEPTEAEAKAEKATEEEKKFAAIPLDSPVQTWFPYVASEQPQTPRALQLIASRTNLVAELGGLVLSEDPKLAHDALHCLGLLPAPPKELVPAVQAAGRDIAARITKFNHTPKEADPSFETAADASTRFYGWLTAVKALREKCGGDFTPELKSILELSRVRPESQCMRQDICRVASFYLHKWADIAPLPTDPKP
ncbi:MAG: class I SAM-dependent methyltransferase [Verrucomicrobiales bacterium]|nr:class I SAM-dependent methyltransferase [Verrucomicrobiales bacterium]